MRPDEKRMERKAVLSSSFSRKCRRLWKRKRDATEQTTDNERHQNKTKQKQIRENVHFPNKEEEEGADEEKNKYSIREIGG